MTRNKFSVLDGMRGGAAFFVLIRHTGPLWDNLNIIHSYIAVDLFFIMSGFVLSHAYDEKLRTGALSVRQFFILRLIRIYPLYFIAAIIGTINLFAGIGSGQAEYHRPPISDFSSSTILTLFLLPSKIGGNDYLFPLNPHFWSLFFELFANLLYAALRSVLTTSVLIVLSVLFALGVAYSAIRHDGLDMGYYWDIRPFAFATIRACSGFFIGLLLHRIYMKKPAIITSNLLSVLALVVMSAILANRVTGSLHGIADCVAAIILFPLLVLASAYVAPTGPFLRSFTFIGMASYPIYLLHPVLGRWFFASWQASFGSMAQTGTPFLGVFFTVLIFTIAYFLDVFFDLPIRRRLSALLLHSSSSLRGGKRS